MIKKEETIKKAEDNSSEPIFSRAQTNERHAPRKEEFHRSEPAKIQSQINVPLATNLPAGQAGVPATAPANAAISAIGEQGGARRRGKSRNKFNDRRPKLATQRRLPPTGIHEGKMGTPKDVEASDDTLKVIPLGGLGEIGKNMYVLEYKDDIIVIDAGIKFPEENMPGIDWLIPNTKYLETKTQNIRGLILTHGHMDHIGAVPYLQQRLGNPDIYTAKLTRGITLKRHLEFPNLPQLPITLVKGGDIVKMGDHFEVEFFHMNHNIPDDLGVLVRTPVGTVIHTADFKFDPNPVNDVPVDFEILKKYGDEGVLALLCDSTDAERTGHSISERTIYDNLELI
ncbi:MAG: ribonuclease J, partial [Patescibacteria group bacterium]